MEEVYVFHLAGDLSIICDEMVARGSRSRADLDVAEMIRRALDLGSHGILVAHNHPSGSPKASRQDVAVTMRIKEAALIFDLTLVDHLIITRTCWTSLRAEGLI